MTKILDLFGYDTTGDADQLWASVVEEQFCPFVNRVCIKTRKSDPEIAIGTCTVAHGRESAPIIICPRRFLERRQVFTDTLHLLTGHEPGNELHIVGEVPVPGGSVDYFLVSAREQKARDFVGIELQAVDTTGTIWPERQRFLQEQGVVVLPADAASTKPYGMNWKMAAKTTLVQLHHKVQTFEHIKKHIVLVLQDHLLSYMRREFSFGHLSKARTPDPMQFHSYSFKGGPPQGRRIQLVERLSTDTAGIARCLDLQTQAKVEFEEIVSVLEARMSTSTIFSPTS